MVSIKLKHYIAVVERYVENDDGSIKKETVEIVLEGRRFSEATVWKKIPRDCKLVTHGWREELWEIEEETLLPFLMKNGHVLKSTTKT